MSRHEVPVAATGLLRTFAEAAMLKPVDFHLARRMAQLSRVDDETVELALALATRELRLGSACLDVASAHTLLPETADDDGLGTEAASALPWPEPEAWHRALRAASCVAGPDDPPRAFRLSGTRLYLERFWTEERRVESSLLQRSALDAMPTSAEALDAALSISPPLAPGDQYRAVEAALTNATTVVTGGPGTGKTTTVARILRGLCDDDHPPLVALAAPTGKAATRLETSVREQLGAAPGLRLRSSTLHKLLDIVPGRERRTYTPDNPLPHDVVIVDETSMVSLTMMAWLLEAVGPDTRLVMLGDPDQLESVEVGAVLADIAGTPGLVAAADGTSAVVSLTHNWRSNSEINALSAAIRAGDSRRVLELLSSGTTCTLVPHTGTEAIEAFEPLLADLLGCASAVRTAALDGDGRAATSALEQHRILCAHREGPFGVSRWAGAARSWLSGRLPDYANGPRHWPGQPLLITRSSDTVSNGDTAVVVRRSGRLMACIDRAEGLLWRDPAALDDVADLHAMTIHKSQGSQFTSVSIVLPPVGSPLLTRQLLYTAVTRARHGVRILGTPDALAQAVDTPARRASGLGRG